MAKKRSRNLDHLKNTTKAPQYARYTQIYPMNTECPLDVEISDILREKILAALDEVDSPSAKSVAELMGVTSQRLASMIDALDIKEQFSFKLQMARAMKKTVSDFSKRTGIEDPEVLKKLATDAMKSFDKHIKSKKPEK